MVLCGTGIVSAQDEGKKKADPPKAVPAAAIPVAQSSSNGAVRPLSVSVSLLSNTKIDGTLTDTTELSMKTSFGPVNVPLSEVAGIKFASKDDVTTTVVMLNGDSITGATDVKLVTVETQWGIAEINGPAIASILFVPGLEWSPYSGLNGKRWNLADEKPAPTRTPATTARSTTTRPSTTNRPSTTTRPGTIRPINSGFPSGNRVIRN
ncbi:MAG: hypothetical protein AAFP69_14975 [Planctomycetota bacterium]